jgi:hypothetical protein
LILGGGVIQRVNETNFPVNALPEMAGTPRWPFAPDLGFEENHASVSLDLLRGSAAMAVSY